MECPGDVTGTGGSGPLLTCPPIAFPVCSHHIRPCRRKANGWPRQGNCRATRMTTDSTVHFLVKRALHKALRLARGQRKQTTDIDEDIMTKAILDDLDILRLADHQDSGPQRGLYIRAADRTGLTILGGPEVARSTSGPMTLCGGVEVCSGPSARQAVPSTSVPGMRS
jgi:hypothetical protein